METTPTHDTWFFQALCTSFALMKAHERELLQDLCYLEEGRKAVSWDLAGMFLDIGLWPPGNDLGKRRPIKEMISQELLAGCILRLIEEPLDASFLEEWTISQSGWYGSPKMEEDGHAAAGTADGRLVPPVQSRDTRGWRSHRLRRPQRSLSGDDDEDGAL